MNLIFAPVNADAANPLMPPTPLAVAAGEEAESFSDILAESETRESAETAPMPRPSTTGTPKADPDTDPDSAAPTFTQAKTSEADPLSEIPAEEAAELLAQIVPQNNLYPVPEPQFKAESLQQAVIQPVEPVPADVIPVIGPDLADSTAKTATGTDLFGGHQAPQQDGNATGLLEPEVQENTASQTTGSAAPESQKDLAPEPATPVVNGSKPAESAPLSAAAKPAPPTATGSDAPIQQASTVAEKPVSNEVPASTTDVLAEDTAAPGQADQVGKPVVPEGQHSEISAARGKTDPQAEVSSGTEARQSATADSGDAQFAQDSGAQSGQQDAHGDAQHRQAAHAAPRQAVAASAQNPDPAQVIVNEAAGSPSVTTAQGPGTIQGGEVDTSTREPISTEQLMQQVKLHVRTGTSRINFLVDPPELGRLNIKLVLRRGRLTGEIHAGSEAVEKALMKGLDALKDTMRRAGVHVDNFEVRSDAGSQDPTDQRGVAHDERQGSRSFTGDSHHRDESKTESANESAVSKKETVEAGDGSINLIA